MTLKFGITYKRGCYYLSAGAMLKDGYFRTGSCFLVAGTFLFFPPRYGILCALTSYTLPLSFLQKLIGMFEVLVVFATYGFLAFHLRCLPHIFQIFAERIPSKDQQPRKTHCCFSEEKTACKETKGRYLL